jgi:hypothetical protein
MIRKHTLWLMAGLLAAATLQAQDQRQGAGLSSDGDGPVNALNRDDDGGRPEEDNISGYHNAPGDVLIVHTIATGTSGSGSEDGNDSDATPERLQPGALDLQASLSVYPNPAVDVLQVRLERECAFTVSLHSLVGKEAYRWSGTAALHRIPVRDLTPGIYFVRLQTGGEEVVRKIRIAH